MTAKEFNIRQKMWKKLHNWEGKLSHAPKLNPLREIGELLELYQKTKPDWQFWTRDFVKGICLLHKKLRIVGGQ